MGLLLTKLYDVIHSFQTETPKRILMLGLDSTGKTTILYKAKQKEQVLTVPTVGFNVETVSPFKGVTFTMWDVASAEKIRPMWRHYFQNTQGLFFVVDSTAVSRMSEAREEFYKVITDAEMYLVPVVVIANKQDLPGALTTAEVADKLRLHEMRNVKWHVQGTCAITGDGIFEALQKMADFVRESKK